MNTDTVAYPPAPAHADERVIRPSAEFKREALGVLWAILFFISVYIALVAGSIVLAAVCGFIGVMLITVYTHFITIMLGLGLLGLGIMVTFFLLKFMFTWSKPDRSHLVRITESEQPELFAFIRRLTKETQSSFPKNIYVSSDVNASVFYDSSFWSMFFPIRKNLEIGLGLVNVVNLSEFKAILAHEFGHFSQRSMKLGSYVYNVNRVIYNMLYDNSGYARTLQRWASISGYFAIFANAVAWIISGIQEILQGVYQFVNKRRMSLSRQMEFHADAVSAYVSGSDHLVTSLRRLGVADICYQRLMGYYNDWLRSHSLKADNLYPQFTEVIHHYAKDFGLPLEHGLLQVSAESFGRFNKTRVVVKDQWASHPSTDDREAHLNQLGLHTDTVHASAWTIFRQAEALQQQITAMIYEKAEVKTPLGTLDLAQFRERYRQEVVKFELPEIYKGFYQSRNIKAFDIDLLDRGTSADTALGAILTDEHLELPTRVDGLNGDIAVLEQINQQNIKVETFDFDGNKYSWSNAGIFLPKLKQELSETEARLEELDKRVAQFFLQRAVVAGRAESLKDCYKRMFKSIEDWHDDLKKFDNLTSIMTPLYQGHVTVEQAHAIANQMMLNEKEIKQRIQTFLADSSYAPVLDAPDRQTLEAYTSKSLTYFRGNSFIEEDMQLFHDAVNLYRYVSSQYSFHLRKVMLEEQAALLPHEG
jgi:Zn-dependent protease with chaperone function